MSLKIDRAQIVFSDGTVVEFTKRQEPEKLARWLQIYAAQMVVTETDEVVGLLR